MKKLCAVCMDEINAVKSRWVAYYIDENRINQPINNMFHLVQIIEDGYEFSINGLVGIGIATCTVMGTDVCPIHVQEAKKWSGALLRVAR